MKKLNVTVSILSSLIALTACSDSKNNTTRTADDHGHSHATSDDHGHAHGAGGHDHHGTTGQSRAAAKHNTPHGGTPVQIGDHGFNLELVPDQIDGKMLAYVLDAHMTKQVNVSGGGFELVAKGAGGEQRLNFTPVTNAANATAEKTSVFSASSPAVKNLTNFEGAIPKITLDGKTFENVTFSFPKGSAHSSH